MELDRSDQRARVLSLTDRGARAHALVTQLFVEIEAEWAASIGQEPMTRLREVLTQILQGPPITAGGGPLR